MHSRKSEKLRGALAKMKGALVGQNCVVVCFSYDDCLLEEPRIVASGGKVERPKFSISECGFMSLAVDTEGNILNFPH
jgi:uncharacterized protein